MNTSEGATPPQEPPRQIRKATTRAESLIIVNTGDGKGKSTAAFGVVLRAVGHSIDQWRRVQKADRANFGLVQEWDPRIQL